MDLDIREYGAGRTIRRKYWIENELGEKTPAGWVLHKEVMEKDNHYRQGAELSSNTGRLLGHIENAWLSSGGKMPEPPDQIRFVINE